MYRRFTIREALNLNRPAPVKLQRPDECNSAIQQMEICAKSRVVHSAFRAVTMRAC